MLNFESKEAPNRTTGERLRLARVAAGLSTRALADRLKARFSISHATLANYERGDTFPSMELVAAIATEVGRPIDWFLKSGNTLRNVRYRNRKSLVSKTACVQFEFTSQTWFDAYLLVEKRLNEPLSKVRKFDLNAFKGTDPEGQARKVREALKLRPDDPVHSVPKIMELFGIRVIEVSTDEAIDGLAARYGDEYVTVLARGLEGDRSRMSASHEFGHFIAGDVDSEFPDSEADARAFAFGSHLLMPSAVLRQAINRRSMVHLVEMKKLYGMSLAAMIYRAEKAGYLSPADAKAIWIEFGKRGWREREPGSVLPDRALRFEILFERAIKLEKVTFDDVSRQSSISVSVLKRRLAEPVGFLDAPDRFYDVEKTQGLRLSQ